MYVRVRVRVCVYVCVCVCACACVCVCVCVSDNDHPFHQVGTSHRSSTITPIYRTKVMLMSFHIATISLRHFNREGLRQLLGTFVVERLTCIEIVAT